MSVLVRLTQNTNVGKKDDLVPDPNGHLVANNLAVNIGTAKEVFDGPVESEVKSDEAGEGQDQSEPTEVEDKKAFKRKDR